MGAEGTGTTSVITTGDREASLRSIDAGAAERFGKDTLACVLSRLMDSEASIPENR